MNLYHHRWFRPCNLDLATFLALIQDSRLLLFSHIVASLKPISPSPIVASSRKEEPVRLIDDATIRLRFGSETFELRRCDMTQGGQDLLGGVWNECITQTPDPTSPFALLVCTLLICFRFHVPLMLFESTADDPGVWKEAVRCYQACFPDRDIPPGPWLSGTAHDAAPPPARTPEE